MHPPSHASGRLLRLATVLAPALLLGACGEGERIQSILHPAGQGARDIAGLWWLIFAFCMAVYAFVIVLLIFAVLRRRENPAPPRPVSALMWIGLGGILMPTVVLILFLGFTVGSLGSFAESKTQARSDVTIKVTGQRWWWEIEYDHPEPQRRVLTANEIYVPVGVPIRVELETRDVIHSFWVPALSGKTDLVPGRVNTLVLNAEQPGVYRGQCAEFCGLQHANMALFVVAVPVEEFEAWYERQLEEAPTPADDLAREGRRVFLEKPCAICHQIRGTLALGRVGPDLTHVASRRSLAAGTVPNTRGYLGGWISDPQGIKPGNMMPNVDLDSGELLALIAYLETLR